MNKKQIKNVRIIPALLLSIITPSYAFAGQGFESVSVLLMTLAIIIIIFIVCREIVCWYWKINQTVALLAEIRDALQYIKKSSISTSSTLLANNQSVDSNDPSHCQHCGKNDAYMDAYNRLYCPNCGDYVNRQAR